MFSRNRSVKKACTEMTSQGNGKEVTRKGIIKNPTSSLKGNGNRVRKGKIFSSKQEFLLIKLKKINMDFV